MGIKIDTGGLLKTIFSSVKRPNFPKLDINGLLDRALGLGGDAGNSAQFKNNMAGHRYRYRVETFQVLLPDSEPIDIITTAIEHIFLTQLYDDAIHPILEIKTLLPPRLHESIVKNKNTVNIRFRLTAVDQNNSNSYQDIINDVFAILIDDEAPFHESKLYDATNTTTNGGRPVTGQRPYNISDYTEAYELSLWREKDLIAMRKTVNEIYNDCTLSSALGHILSNAGIDKTLISPLNNTQQYGQLIIPPMNLMNVFDYLQQTYGTYYFGTMYFYDFRCLYVLNKSGACDCYEDGEYKKTIISIFDPTNSRHAATGTFESPDDQEYHIYLDPQSISISTPSTMEDVISGNNVTIVDPKNNETTEVSGAGQQRGMGSSKVVSDKFGNNFNKSVMLSEINERNLHISMYIVDHNIFAMTPNKEFVINFTDKEKMKYSGYYRLISAVTAFTKNGELFNCAAQYEMAQKSGLSSDEVVAINAKVNPNLSKPVSTAKKVATPPQPKELSSNFVDASHLTLVSNTLPSKQLKTDSLGNSLDTNYKDTYRIESGDSPERVAYKEKKQANTPSKAPRPRIRD